MNSSVNDATAGSNAAYLAADILANIVVWTDTVVLPISCIIGLLCNPCIVVLLSCNKCGMSKTSRLYYVLMAAFDTATLANYHATRCLPYLFPWLWLSPFMPHTFLLGCRITMFFMNFCTSMSLSVLCLFCAERTFSLYFPFRAKAWLTRRLSGSVLIVCSAILFFLATSLVSSAQLMLMPDVRLSCPAWTFYSSLDLFTVIALDMWEAVMVFVQACLTILLAIKFLAVNSRRRRLLSSQGGPPMSAKDVNVTVTLLTLSFTSLTISCPQFLIFAVAGFLKIPLGITMAIVYFGTEMLQLDSVMWCLNFFILLKQRPFRQALLRNKKSKAKAK